MLLITQSEVQALLPMSDCTAAMQRALAALAAGEAGMPLRTVMWLPGRIGALGAMPAYLDSPRVFGLKVISVFPGNHGTEFDSHQGAVMLFEAAHGRPLAIVDATAITAIRTAATSGVATKVVEADLICTTTSSADPVLLGEWLAPGAHINAVGSSVPSARELDTAAVARSRLFVDRRESALNEAGDILMPMQEGAVGDKHIVGEIGEVLLGRVAGRTSDHEITLFKSLGLAVEDVAAAQQVYARALETGAGTAVELGGRRRPPRPG